MGIREDFGQDFLYLYLDTFLSPSVELWYNGTHLSEHLGIMNTTKVIVARAIVTKESCLSHHVISSGFQYNKHFTMKTFQKCSIY